MTTYEILLLLDPEQAEARQDEIVARTRGLVERNGRSHPGQFKAALARDLPDQVRSHAGDIIDAR